MIPDRRVLALFKRTIMAEGFQPVGEWRLLPYHCLLEFR
jgi:hypothetical protein